VYIEPKFPLTLLSLPMKRVVVTENIHPDGIAMLKARDDLQVEFLDGDADRLPQAVVGAHAILVRSMQLTEDLLASATDLEIVSRHGVGCDNIAVGALSARGIPVAIATDSNTTSVVEHVLMLMLALNKQVMAYDQLTRDGRFSDRGMHRTSELHGKHVLVIGFGRIGKRVAPVCKAFGMRVTVADIELDAEYAAELGCDAVEDFKPVLADADYVTVHVPLDDTTRSLIGAAELDAMPSHAILINCARGGVVDEQALASAIRNKSIAFYGGDVFSTEPPAPDNPLLTLPNSIITPHNAAGPDESMQRMATYAASNIINHFDGALTPDFVFNPEVFAQ
jgi:D-3-phosphoglycerate dehydrogenase